MHYDRLRLSLSLFFVVLIAGIIGFMVFEDLVFVDAAYMAVVTIATVGLEILFLKPKLVNCLHAYLLLLGWVLPIIPLC